MIDHVGDLRATMIRTSAVLVEPLAFLSIQRNIIKILRV